ncbi:CAAX protease [Sediminicola sp. YIK13]|uniref:CPBP family intramembrane glutamic endopeptidase n=1 Tax=Sediminicola sp. YIK13 TaxID=1453352 RepID=UPI00071FC19C|nr:CPBP family intramembrane glutamic endopeptidase [Sediminicola sp. YIK13]ALM07229.1 CAAX protease [Sediminicola sp. YIK13]
MYIEQAYKGFHEGWRYVVGIMIIFLGWQVVGMLPLVGTLIVKSIGTGSMPGDITGMSALLGTNLFLFLMLLSFAFGLLATLLTAKLVHRQKIIHLTTSRKKVDWKRISFAFFLWAIISIVMVGADIVFSPEDYIFNFKLEPFLYLLVIGALLIPVQTSCEEYLMRGYLMQGIGIMVKNRWLPLLITSLIFGLLHLGNPEVEKLGYGIMVYYIGTGLFLGILTLMDEGLELSLGFHAANNLTTALLVTADWTAFQTDSLYRDISQPELGWDVFIPVLVIYPTLLYIFSKKYGWKNWKERLLGNIHIEKSIN